jgi:uncharacterized protein
MMMNKSLMKRVDEVVDVVACAGGQLVGRTRLQKTIYLLGLMGLSNEEFHFQYKHYGPFSESLASITDISKLFGCLQEEQQPSSWGGVFSVYRTAKKSDESENSVRQRVILLSKDANAIDLELAATAAYLALEGYPNPWEETSARKPDKRDRVGSAKALYTKFLALGAPVQLPAIV